MLQISTLKVLSSMRKNGVKSLLMGGQACILYGVGLFSDDTDLALLCDEPNVERLQSALAELQARVIAVPPFDIEFLRRGHAIHFRCEHPEAPGQRVDVMSVMRGVAPFPELWERRATVLLPEGDEVDLLSLSDLVRAKKTQRDKDWPMIQRIVAVHYFENRDEPTPPRIEFWLRELRTPDYLQEVAERFPEETALIVSERDVLNALPQGEDAVRAALWAEQERERIADHAYWQPLRAELEQLRRQIRRASS